MSGKAVKNSPSSAADSSDSPGSVSFSSVYDVVPESAGSSLATATKLSLVALKDILEAVDSLPCVKYIAGVGIKILDITDEVQSNKEAMRNIGMRASDIVLAVARACEQAKADMAVALESDLRQLTGTMDDIFNLASEIAARPGYKRLLYKTEDAGSIKALDAQLTHAFQIFEVQSSISLRISQQQMAQMLRDAPGIARRAPTTRTPLHVPEGIYVIRNARDGRVLEIDHARLRTGKQSVHVYVAPFREEVISYQLWVVFKREGREFEYTVRSFATGAVLDVFRLHDREGTHVVGHSANGRPNQLWAFYATRSVASFDYCTIRSYGPPTVMDSRCKTGDGCDYLHMSRLQRDRARASQEWSLTRLPSTPAVTRPALLPRTPQPTPLHIPRRPFRLQNIASGGYATPMGLDDKMDDSNVLVETDAARAGAWHFVLATDVKDASCDPYEEMFAIATGAGPQLASLDHYAQRHVRASFDRFSPSTREHMWKVVPRDGGFSFLNMATKRLLCQSRTGGVVDTAPQSACDNPSCMWRLVDARTGEVCRLLYDAIVSVVVPELVGTAAEAVSAQSAPPSMVLRAQEASSEMAERFVEGLKHEHDLIRDMLKSGYTAVVLGPQLVMGCKDGRISKTYLQDGDSMLGMPKFKGKDSFESCPM